MEIEFDTEKDAANMRKHGVSLNDATILLEGPHDVDLDGALDYGEERWIAFREIAGRPHICVYTMRGDVYRVISLRGATRREINAHRER